MVVRRRRSGRCPLHRGRRTGGYSTGTTSRGRAEIEALATGLFKTDADVRLEVTDGFVGETWAGWNGPSRTRQETGGEVTFRGASVLELEDA